MKVSMKGLRHAALVCAIVSFPLSTHAATSPSERACTPPNYVVADLGECLGEDASFYLFESFAQFIPAGDRPALVAERRLEKFREDRDRWSESKRARPGPEWRLGGPLTAAEEDFANRAYPGTDIPLEVSRNAQVAFNRFQGRGWDDDQANQWTLIGPSGVNFPGVLTFGGADYIDSGRITALVLSPHCSRDHCSLYVGAAGGGIWRTDEPFGRPEDRRWRFLSASFGTNAIGTLVADPTDPTGNTLYAGTGEPNTSSDSEAGVGIYSTKDGGETWTKVPDLVTAITTAGNGTYTGDAFAGRSIAGILIDPTSPNVIYVATTRGVRGVSSVAQGATSNPPTPRPPFGLWKSTDGGATFSFIWNGNASIRGVSEIKLDPGNSNIVYAAALDQGTWRSMDGGATFTQIQASLSANDPDRPSFAVTQLPNGKTRMYLGEGAGSSANPVTARLFRSDDVTASVPLFTDLTTDQTIGYCDDQCWYDNVVYSPMGEPDVVYLGGSYDYGNFAFVNNGRAFIYSTDAGSTFSDLTWDATTTPTTPGSCCQPYATAPHAMHPDSHAIVEVPGTAIVFFGGDGGLTRTSGSFADASAQCAGRGVAGSSLGVCQQLLSRIPTELHSLNLGLSTLQFQSLSVDPSNADVVQGGTQDNGTLATDGSSPVWSQIIYGDGGQSGFNAANPQLRFNSFTGPFNDVNFRNGDPTKWVVAAGRITGTSPENAYFYAPVIADPAQARGGTIFQGSNSVWRTQDWGGDQAYLEANCPEFITPANDPACGDFAAIGSANATDLTDSGLYGPAVYGPDRRGGFVAALARSPSDTGTLWVATGTGRVFISKNADAAAGTVAFTRLDSLPSAAAAPNRFVTAIYVDPRNTNHAWISYSGYMFNTPTQPGHVFEVTYTGADAQWTQIDGGSGGLADLPITGLVRDDRTGDLYASNDFGVMRLRRGSTTWKVAAAGLPMVEVNGLTIAVAARKLFAATHGRGAWALRLPGGEDQR